MKNAILKALCPLLLLVRINASTVQRFNASTLPRLTCLLLWLLTWAGTAPAQFTYTTNNGAITITGPTYTGWSANLTIPSTLNGYPVAAIADGAFYNCLGLTSLTISNGVTSIGGDAFGSCYDLTSVTIPNSVTNIGNLEFECCQALTSVTIPGSVTSLGNAEFAQCYQLTNAFFQGNAPTVGGLAGTQNASVFAGETGTVYYLPGTSGWG